VIVSAAFLAYAAEAFSWLVLSLGGRGAGMSRRIAASIATAAGSSIRSGSPCSVRELRASSASACRMAARSSALIVAGGLWSSVAWPHPLPTITVRGCPRPCPRLACVPTRAGAREAVGG
jgi:hypothetical protein